MVERMGRLAAEAEATGGSERTGGERGDGHRGRLQGALAGAAYAVQRRALEPGAGTLDAGGAIAVATQGTEGGGGPLPYLEVIQAAFGAHDVSGVRAHIGGAAGVAACAQLGAEAYAAGESVVFASAPDLHTAAHEAAHVVQQRRGLAGGGLGRADDALERQADAVADRVVAGQSAEALLDGTGGGGGASVQRKANGGTDQGLANFDAALALLAKDPRDVVPSIVAGHHLKANLTAETVARVVDAGAGDWLFEYAIAEARTLVPEQSLQVIAFWRQHGGADTAQLDAYELYVKGARGPMSVLLGPQEESSAHHEATEAPDAGDYKTLLAKSNNWLLKLTADKEKLLALRPEHFRHVVARLHQQVSGYWIQASYDAYHGLLKQYFGLKEPTEFPPTYNPLGYLVQQIGAARIDAERDQAAQELLPTLKLMVDQIHVPASVMFEAPLAVADVTPKHLTTVLSKQQYFLNRMKGLLEYARGSSQRLGGRMDGVAGAFETAETVAGGLVVAGEIAGSMVSGGGLAALRVAQLVKSVVGSLPALQKNLGATWETVETLGGLPAKVDTALASVSGIEVPGLLDVLVAPGLLAKVGQARFPTELTDGLEAKLARSRKLGKLGGLVRSASGLGERWNAGVDGVMGIPTRFQTWLGGLTTRLFEHGVVVKLYRMFQRLKKVGNAKELVASAVQTVANLPAVVGGMIGGRIDAVQGFFDAKVLGTIRGFDPTVLSADGVATAASSALSAPALRMVRRLFEKRYGKKVAALAFENQTVHDAATSGIEKSLKPLIATALPSSVLARVGGLGAELKTTLLTAAEEKVRAPLVGAVAPMKEQVVEVVAGQVKAMGLDEAGPLLDRLGIQRKAHSSSADASAVDPGVEQALKSSQGRPLAADTRARMEEGFGGERFADVRIHALPGATRALSAKAMTWGRDIYVDPAHYAEGTREGDALLAHELAHVIQQRGSRREESAGVQLKATVGGTDDAYEREADRASADVMARLGGADRAAEVRGTATGRIQRMPDPEALRRKLALEGVFTGLLGAVDGRELRAMAEHGLAAVDAYDDQLGGQEPDEAEAGAFLRYQSTVKAFVDHASQKHVDLVAKPKRTKRPGIYELDPTLKVAFGKRPHEGGRAPIGLGRGAGWDAKRYPAPAKPLVTQMPDAKGGKRLQVDDDLAQTALRTLKVGVIEVEAYQNIASLLDPLETVISYLEGQHPILCAFYESLQHDRRVAKLDKAAYDKQIASARKAAVAGDVRTVRAVRRSLRKALSVHGKDGAPTAEQVLGGELKRLSADSHETVLFTEVRGKATGMRPAIAEEVAWLEGEYAKAGNPFELAPATATSIAEHIQGMVDKVLTETTDADSDIDKALAALGPDGEVDLQLRRFGYTAMTDRGHKGGTNRKDRNSADANGIGKCALHTAPSTDGETFEQGKIQTPALASELGRHVQFHLDPMAASELTEGNGQDRAKRLLVLMTRAEEIYHAVQFYRRLGEGQTDEKASISQWSQARGGADPEADAAAHIFELMPGIRADVARQYANRYPEREAVMEAFLAGEMGDRVEGDPKLPYWDQLKERALQSPRARARKIRAQLAALEGVEDTPVNEAVVAAKERELEVARAVQERLVVADSAYPTVAQQIAKERVEDLELLARGRWSVALGRVELAQLGEAVTRAPTNKELAALLKAENQQERSIARADRRAGKLATMLAASNTTARAKASELVGDMTAGMTRRTRMRENPAWKKARKG